MRHLDLFSGIGGFSLAADRVWHEEKNEHIFVEYEPFPQAVLRKHWPHAEIHGNIREYAGGGTAHLVTGGFPCQPFSNAGKRGGTEDDRYLWPEMLRVIRAVSPCWVIGENVDGLTTWNGGLVLETVVSDLEDARYQVQTFVIPAASVEAPHGRDRVWIVAHSDSSRCIHGQIKKFSAKRREHALGESGTGSTHVANTRSVERERSIKEPIFGQRDIQRKSGRSSERKRDGWPTEPAVGRVANGIPNRMDRIKALGNAIVPQVAEEIIRAIRVVDETV